MTGVCPVEIVVDTCDTDEFLCYKPKAIYRYNSVVFGQALPPQEQIIGQFFGKPSFLL